MKISVTAAVLMTTSAAARLMSRINRSTVPLRPSCTKRGQKMPLCISDQHGPLSGLGQMTLLKFAKASSAIVLTATFAAPTTAQFFFIFPLPRGPSDPDKIEATSEQRQYAMCSAYHANVIDPNLSGNRQKSWRGDVMRSAEDAMKEFPQFMDLRNRYIRQWQLQIKGSFEAGTSYSQMLANGCVKAGLPYAQEQLSAASLNKGPSAQAPLVRLVDREAEPLELPASVNKVAFTKTPIDTSSILLDVEITKDGRPKSCRSFVDGANVQLETEACQYIASWSFKPKVESGFATAGFYQVYATRMAQ